MTQPKQPNNLLTILLCAILVILLVIGTLQIIEFVTLRKAVASLQENVLGVDVKEVNEAIASLSEAADNLAKADVQTLNETAASLREAAQKLSEVDMESLNKLVSSISSVTEQLEKTIKGITTLNGLLGN